MSFYISLLLSISVLGLLSRSWQQRWRARQTAKLERPAVGGQLGQLSERVGAEFAALRNKVAFDTNHPPAWAERVRQVVTTPPLLRATASQQAELAQRFRRWAATALQEELATSAWLAALSTEANIAFTHQIAEFCEEMGFDLAALVDGQLDQVPNAAQQATQIVRHYCRANYQAAVAQNDFDATKRLLAYLRAPFQKANQTFGQQLYSKLVERQVVSVALPTTEEAPAQVLEIICQAAASNPTDFSTVLNEVIHESFAV